MRFPCRFARARGLSSAIFVLLFLALLSAPPGLGAEERKAPGVTTVVVSSAEDGAP